MIHSLNLKRPEMPFVSVATLDKLAKVSSGSLTTQLFKRGFRQPVMVGLKPIGQPGVSPSGKAFAGRAFTMRFIPAREDIDTYSTLTTEPNVDNLQWVGTEQIGRDEVMVIDSYNNIQAASMGNMLITRLSQRGARGVVTDGAFRDGLDLVNMHFPIWAQTTTATTRLSFHHVADLQVPIGCAGVAVYPGDVIHSDGDSITVVPAYLADELAQVCTEQDDMEYYLHQRVAKGESLWGVYPANAVTRAQYQQWVANGRPGKPKEPTESDS
jgi:regulator of RNase E activity RraA